MGRPSHRRPSLRPDITGQEDPLTTASFAPTARTLEVPGARLYHEVRGKGPLLLLVGAPMDAGVDKQWNGQWHYGAVGRLLTPLAVPMQVGATGRNLVSD